MTTTQWNKKKQITTKYLHSQFVNVSKKSRYTRTTVNHTFAFVRVERYGLTDFLLIEHFFLIHIFCVDKLRLIISLVFWNNHSKLSRISHKHSDCKIIFRIQ